MTKITLIPIFKKGYTIEIRSTINISVIRANNKLTYTSPKAIGLKIKIIKGENNYGL